MQGMRATAAEHVGWQLAELMTPAPVQAAHAPANVKYYQLFVLPTFTMQYYYGEVTSAMIERTAVYYK